MIKLERKIEPAMVEFLDKKLASNGLAQKAIAEKEFRILFTLAMEALVGIKEEGGNNKGRMIVLIQETVGGHDREPYCMAAVGTCIAYCEVKTGIKSPFPVTEHCLTAWHNAPEELKVKTIPNRGAIPIWQHGKSQAGHTGVLTEWIGDGKFWTVEANTSSGVNAEGKIVREGSGIYHQLRKVDPIGDMHLLGFLKPI
jgi:hypothetical protein